MNIPTFGVADANAPSRKTVASIGPAASSGSRTARGCAAALLTIGAGLFYAARVLQTSGRTAPSLSARRRGFEPALLASRARPSLEYLLAPGGTDVRTAPAASRFTAPIESLRLAVTGAIAAQSSNAALILARSVFPAFCSVAHEIPTDDRKTLVHMLRTFPIINADFRAIRDLALFGLYGAYDPTRAAHQMLTLVNSFTDAGRYAAARHVLQVATCIPDAMIQRAAPELARMLAGVPKEDRESDSFVPSQMIINEFESCRENLM